MLRLTELWNNRATQSIMMGTPIHLIVKGLRNYEMCSIYSSFDRQDEQKLSIENQRSLFYQYLEDRGWDVFDFYVDVESGTTIKRENLTRLIQDAKARKFDVIAAKELSRLARNGGLSYQIKDIARDNSVHIVTLDNAIYTLERKDEMFGLYANK